MKLRDRFFPSRAELDSLKAERDALAEQNESLRQREATARQREREHSQREETLKTELRQTKEQLRDQTDADLLLISQRITAKIVEGDKPTRNEIDEQQRLMAQRQTLASQLNAQNAQGAGSLAGLNSALGGGLFGFR